MKDTMFETYPLAARLQMLIDNAYAREETKLERFHTAEEKEALRNTATDEMIQCQDIEEEIKKLTEPLKGQLKTVKSELRTHLKAFKRGYESEDVTLFAFDEQEEGMMVFYDAEGKLVKSRKLHPSERQTKILTMPNTSSL